MKPPAATITPLSPSVIVNPVIPLPRLLEQPSRQPWSFGITWTGEDEQAFAELQARLPGIWQRATDDPYAEQTVLVVPSMSLDEEELRKLKGVEHYEERMLFMLILLRMISTRVVFVTSQPVDPCIVDYYLNLLPGIPASHARRRLHMLAAHDGSLRPLTQKILERPALMQRIRNCLPNSPNVHMTVFNVTPMERRLSLELGVPLFGPRAPHQPFGLKSGARQLFKSVGVSHAPGFEDLRDEQDIAEAVAELYAQHPHLRRVVIKLNDGFSGDGNAIYPLAALDQAAVTGSLTPRRARTVVLNTLHSLTRFQAEGLVWESFQAKFRQMEGVVEGFIEGDEKTSPSVQLRLTPLGEVEIVSTHDQILGGPGGQVFLGCRFPARRAYREQLHEAARVIGRRLVEEGVMSRLSVDFVAVPTASGQWDLFAVEINLRKGGTTHPYRTLQLLTGGSYYPERGLFVTGSGEVKYYMASDNLVSPRYHGLIPEDLIDITTFTRLHYRSSTHTGTVFHMIGALSEFGKVGVTCIGNSRKEAFQLYRRTSELLNEHVSSTRWVVS